MADNIQRNRGRGQGYKYDRGGTPSEFGPFIGVVRNNIDPTRSGRLQVWIEQFAGDNPDDQSLWRTVSYCPPFYGLTNPGPNNPSDAGSFTTNNQSYGMWFTPPDINTQVICFFVAGDPNQGYYLGCIPDQTINHMLPAIGASKNFVLDNSNQNSYFAGATQLPVTEINDSNESIRENPRFFDQPKPVHSYLAGIMMQQGLIKDTIRGPITSNSQRESPSSVYGISTPGKPVYQGGLTEKDIKTKLEQGALLPQDVKVIARRGGHTLVLDDGDLQGKDNLIRIRTSKGHQITMSDDGDCFYIIHANGQTWIELGKQGTVDVFSTNSVNVRTQGTINLHADKDINMYAGGNFNVKSRVMKLEADGSLDILTTGKLTLYSKNYIGVKSDGILAMQNKTIGSWNGGKTMNLVAGMININSGGAQPVTAPTAFKEYKLDDTVFVTNQGWVVKSKSLDTIVTRAPTHEPYPYHNQGVSVTVNLSGQVFANPSSVVSNVLSKLINIPVTDPIDDAAFLQQNPAEISVGALDKTQVTALMAQISNQVGQNFDEFSVTKGIGTYGLSPTQLESAGFLKPGTVATYLRDPNQLETVLSNPNVWTGKNGVDNLTTLLVDPKLQSLTQNAIMVNSLTQLQQSGVITGNETAPNIAPLVQATTRFGINTAIAWLKGTSSPSLTNDINAVAKGAQYAMGFVDTKASTSLTGGFNLGGYTNTVARDPLDSALSQIIGNSKIPLPDFSSGLYTSVPNADLTYTGDDYLIWDRVNAERLRRGLPGLAAIGYPRPATS